MIKNEHDQVIKFVYYINENYFTLFLQRARTEMDITLTVRQNRITVIAYKQDMNEDIFLYLY